MKKKYEPKLHVQQDSEGKKYKSVTTIIGRQLHWGVEPLNAWIKRCILSNIDPDAIKIRSGQIGTLAHSIIEKKILNQDFLAYIEETKSEYSSDVHEEAVKKVNAFDAIYDNVVKEYLLVETEKRVNLNNLWSIAGTVDIIAKDLKTDRICIGDIKTGKQIHDSNIIQVAAYSKLIKEEMNLDYIPECFFIHLGEAKKGSIIHVPSNKIPIGIATFECLVELERLQTMFL